MNDSEMFPENVEALRKLWRRYMSEEMDQWWDYITCFGFGLDEFRVWDDMAKIEAMLNAFLRAYHVRMLGLPEDQEGVRYREEWLRELIVADAFAAKAPTPIMQAVATIELAVVRDLAWQCHHTVCGKPPEGRGDVAPCVSAH